MLLIIIPLYRADQEGALSLLLFLLRCDVDDVLPREVEDLILTVWLILFLAFRLLDDLLTSKLNGAKAMGISSCPSFAFSQSE